MKKTNVTAIIPVYNEEKYIGECLGSLFKQTLKPLEVIVIDDGSTDDSVKIIKKSPTELFKQKHQGPGKARNLRAKKAKGEILVFPDADMRLDKRYLEKLIKPIVEGKALATFTKEEYVANPQNIWSQCWSINSGWPENLHIDPKMPDEANNFRAILKKVFLKTKGYKNVGYGEDVTVLAQFEKIKAKVAPGAVCYHFNPSSLKEVFLSARWMGRGETFEWNGKTLLTYFCFNSFRKGILESLRHNKPQFLIFKLVFDFGITIGLLDKKIRRVHVK